MEGCINGWVDKYMDKWIDGEGKDGWMNRQVSGWMNECTVEGMTGWMD